MAKGKAAKPAAGQLIQVNDGVTMPEFPDLPISGWRGVVLETTGSGAKLKVIFEWDAAAQAAMPENYRQHCTNQGLALDMACLAGSDVHVVED